MRAFVLDESIRSSFANYLLENGLTHAAVAPRMGFTPTRITKYLGLNKEGAKPEPDAARVQESARRLMHNIGRMAALKETLFTSSVTEQVAAVLRYVRRESSVALIRGHGGLGKSCGAMLYCKDHPNSLFVTMREYARNKEDLQNFVLMEHEKSTGEKWPGGIKKGLWLENRLRGSECLIIVDDAELLAIAGFRWIFSFNDHTQCPVALIGNSEVTLKLQTYDTSGKLLSRLGRIEPITLGDDLDTIASNMIKLHAPEANELTEAVTNALSSFGHLRRVKMRLILTNISREFGKEKDWMKQWNDAGKLFLASAVREAA